MCKIFPLAFLLKVITNKQVELGMDRDHCVWNVIYKATIKSIVTVWNVEIISNKFYVKSMKNFGATIFHTNKIKQQQ
jgi:hypothetical protein